MKIHSRLRARIVLSGLITVMAAWCAMGGLASAAFPNFSDCPRTGLPSGSGCIDVQSQSGEIVIKGFHVPLGHSLEIRGALREPDGVFVPPRGTNGFFAEPVNVPGGVLGIELPISLNMVTATAELAGPASSIELHPGNLEIRMPIKLHLSNPLIGSNCYIGSNSRPVIVHLIVGTTSPPPPNRPITGNEGTAEIIPPDTLLFRDVVDVENSFSIPSATGCGFLGILNPLINLKLGLPSAAGNNSMVINNEAGLRLIP